MGSVGIVEMLHRSNLMGIVAGGNHPIVSPCSVLIWDDKPKHFILEYAFKSQVHSLRMSLNRLVVVLRSRIYVFAFPNHSRRLFQFDTCDNPRGLCELSTTDEQLLCFPSVKPGFVQIAVSASLALSPSPLPFLTH